MGATFTVLPTPAEGRQDLPAVPWDALPQEALAKIFRYLQDWDRCQASLACKAWHRVFRMACLWRSRSFVFPGSEMQQVCYDGFLREHGQHLQHVILDFEFQNNAALQCFKSFVTTANESAAFLSIKVRHLCFEDLPKRWSTYRAKSFQAFVARANKCAAFQSIKVRHLCFSYLPNRWSTYRPKMVRALCLLLKRQPMLQEADFCLCQFTHNEGLQVLKALTGDLRLKPRRNITTLSLREFFEAPTHYISLSTFTEVMGRFTALAFLRVDQHYLCEDVLDKLITGCAQTLRHLDIVMNARVVHAIDSHTWRLAVQRCPSLTVTVRLEIPYTFEEYSRVLVESMPLTRVFLWGRRWRGNIAFADVARFLGYVSDIFFNTIEEVCVYSEAEGYQEVDKTVEKLIETCVRLKRLSLCIPLKPETLDKLSRVVAARPQNEMKRLEVTVVVDEEMNTGYIQERWPSLHGLSFDELFIDDF
ncbi:F-box only protein 39-like isoform X2 [Pomacea canaliculata]|uniref:F-box only protein 39-like isoform X2 n=1 Tax=Pomacea canaliculata TaxID=400727 RepID=UPI000D72FF03|nr:F-box only protein 39-like isoform X2 [Pomacea canaliculata]